MKPTKKLLALIGLTVALVASGCSSDNNSSNNNANNGVTPPTVSESFVPDSASVSNEAYISYLLSLNAADEASEPLSLKESFAVSADEVNDPQPLV
jgi:hypothetical protein